MGCNYVLSISQKVDHMGKVLEEHDWGKSQKRAKKIYMPFCYCPRSFILEMVSSSRSRTIGEEKVDRAPTWGQEEEGDYKGEVHKKQETFEPYTYFFWKGKTIRNKDNQKSNSNILVWWWWRKRNSIEEAKNTKRYYNEGQC
jgi:hypothetical protein